MRAILIFLITSTTTRQFAGYPYTKGTRKAAKISKIIFKLDTLYPHGTNDRLSFHRD